MKIKKLGSIAVMMGLCFALAGCTSKELKKASDKIIENLEATYNDSFEVIDIDKRATSDVNDLGDVYYAYVKYTGADEAKQNKGFYCELNKNMTYFKEFFADVRFRPSLDGYYASTELPEDAIVVTSVSTTGDEYFTRYNYKEIINQGVDYSVTVVIPVSEDYAEYLSGELCFTELEGLWERTKNYEGSLYVVYCDPEYVDEKVAYLNHLQDFDYKVKYKQIIADIAIDFSRTSSVKDSFIRQMNSDLNAR